MERLMLQVCHIFFPFQQPFKIIVEKKLNSKKEEEEELPSSDWVQLDILRKE